MALVFQLPLQTPYLATPRKEKSKRSSRLGPFFPTYSSTLATRRGGMTRVNAFFNPLEDPLIKPTLKEPVAFTGGMIAALLRLDVSEGPLKDWIRENHQAARKFSKGSKGQSSDDKSSWD